jgi:hypothetical protein
MSIKTFVTALVSSAPKPSVLISESPLCSALAPGRTTGRLFDDETLDRFRRVIPVVDMLNKKYGRDTVRLAGANPKGCWRTKAAKRSPRYTTKLAEVPRLR